MKRIILSILVLMTFVSVCVAGNYKYWNEGALSWEDFTGTPEMKTTPTFFKGRLIIKDKSDLKELKENVYSLYALAAMDQSVSYSEKEFETDQALRYHQLQFDLLEIMRRRLQADLNTGMTGIEADRRLAHYQNLYNEQIADLARHTVNGSNDKRLQEEEYFVRKQLDEYILPKAKEEKPSKFSYGWYAGTGALIPTADIADIFKYSWLFNIGLTAGYDRLYLKADVSYGQPKLKDLRTEISGKPQEWAVNKYANQLSGIVVIGYRVVDTKRFAITPNIGGGWTNYAWDVADFKFNEEDKIYERCSDIRKFTMSNFNIMGSIDFDWKFHTAVSDKPMFRKGRKEQYSSSLRISPYVMHQKYTQTTPERSGLQVGVMVTYVGIARALGFK